MMQAIRQYANVENGYVHIKLPPDFSEKEVEVIILALEKKPQPQKQITEEDALAIHAQLMDDYSEAFAKLAQ
jgi:thiamine pyrophosphate-dependent acetolactate synthase large subunit-like protein